MGGEEATGDVEVPGSQQLAGYPRGCVRTRGNRLAAALLMPIAPDGADVGVIALTR